MCAGRTISIAFWKGWDDPGYGQEWDLQDLGYDGLDLIPGGSSIFPHYSGHWCTLVQAKRQQLRHEVLLLDEDHACVVQGDQVDIIPTTAQQHHACPSKINVQPMVGFTNRTELCWMPMTSR